MFPIGLIRRRKPNSGLKSQDLKVQEPKWQLGKTIGTVFAIYRFYLGYATIPNKSKLQQCFGSWKGKDSIQLEDHILVFPSSSFLLPTIQAVAMISKSYVVKAELH